jgi:hypothetical protein
MYVRELVASMLRRWYFVLAGVSLTVGLCFAAFTLVPVTYEAKGSMLLLPPKSSVGQRGNPYLYLGGLAQAVEVVSARINSTDVRNQIQKAFPGAQFEAGQDTTTTGPILAVTASSTSDADSLAVVRSVMNSIPDSLELMQDDLQVPDSSRITATVLTVDAQATEVTKARDRAVIALAGGGLAGTVLLTGFLDGLLIARRPRELVADYLLPPWVVSEQQQRGPDPMVDLRTDDHRARKQPQAASAVNNLAMRERDAGLAQRELAYSESSIRNGSNGNQLNNAPEI